MAKRRLNVATYAQMLTRGRLETSKFTKGKCLMPQSQLMMLKKWEVGKLEARGEHFWDDELAEALAVGQVVGRRPIKLTTISATRCPASSCLRLVLRSRLPS